MFARKKIKIILFFHADSEEKKWPETYCRISDNGCRSITKNIFTNTNPVLSSVLFDVYFVNLYILSRCFETFLTLILRRTKGVNRCVCASNDNSSHKINCHLWKLLQQRYCSNFISGRKNVSDRYLLRLKVCTNGL